jgi:hypothetical protein
MNLDRVEQIAEAVLYEGYMLYPYRASAVKNQQRWNFGVLCPYSESQNGHEAWTMQTQCLLQAGPSARLNVKIRFLQIVNRFIGRLTYPLLELSKDAEPEFAVVNRLEVGGETFVPWQEAVEREVSLLSMHSCAVPIRQRFEFPAGRAFEPPRNEDGLIAAVIIRQWETLSGSTEIELKRCLDGVIKATVSIQNLTPYKQSEPQRRADAMAYSLVSTHTILGLEDGEFISMIDPPVTLKKLAEECRNIGTWPVLVGDEGDRDTVLSSPIILYDYPQIAPESPGGLFDGTEIDEILSLRILTMTDEEKREMRQSDQRARQILERTESMLPEQFMDLHGAMRGLRPMNKETIQEVR